MGEPGTLQFSGSFVLPFVRFVRFVVPFIFGHLHELCPVIHESLLIPNVVRDWELNLESLYPERIEDESPGSGSDGDDHPGLRFQSIRKV